MNKPGYINAQTASFISSMSEVATTLNSSFTSLLSVSIKLAEIGQDKEAMRLIELAQGIQSAEVEVRRHAEDASFGKIVKMSEH